MAKTYTEQLDALADITFYSRSEKTGVIVTKDSALLGMTQPQLDLYNAANKWEGSFEDTRKLILRPKTIATEVTVTTGDAVNDLVIKLVIGISQYTLATVTTPASPVIMTFNLFDFIWDNTNYNPFDIVNVTIQVEQDLDSDSDVVSFADFEPKTVSLGVNP
jgi:hypothetical protein